MSLSDIKANKLSLVVPVLAALTFAPAVSQAQEPTTQTQAPAIEMAMNESVQPAVSYSTQPSYTDIRIRDLTNYEVKEANGAAALASGNGMVIVFYGHDQTVRDEIRAGASEAVDEAGNLLTANKEKGVKGMVIAKGNTNTFKIYADGIEVTHDLGPQDAYSTAKLAIEKTYEKITSPELLKIRKSEVLATEASYALHQN